MSKTTRLRRRALSETNIVKDDIQEFARQIVIKRDGGCILRNFVDIYGLKRCGGYRKDGQPILQADHLITRGNSATYSDTRLIVCICRDHHKWKVHNKEHYDDILRQILPTARVALWDKAKLDSWKPHRNYTYDWKLELAALKTELRTYEVSNDELKEVLGKL